MVVAAVAKVLGWPGFGYHPPKFVVRGKEVEAPQELAQKTDEVVRQVELLEWELRRGGADRGC